MALPPPAKAARQSLDASRRWSRIERVASRTSDDPLFRASLLQRAVTHLQAAVRRIPDLLPDDNTPTGEASFTAICRREALCPPELLDCLPSLAELATEHLSTQPHCPDWAAGAVEQMARLLPVAQVRVARYLDQPRWGATPRWIRRTLYSSIGATLLAAAIMAGMYLEPSRATACPWGSYFPDPTLSGTARKRRDCMLDFDWKTGGPFPSWRSDRFSARWDGRLRIEQAGFYTFYLGSDDGARLRVDGQWLLDQWREQAFFESQATTYLQPGLVPIRIEYYEALGSARLYVAWEHHGQPKAMLTGADFAPRPD